MLIGDHGQIIPFRRFKGIATAFIIVLVITLIALTILSFLYLRQTDSLQQLTIEMEKLKTQAEHLRNEKDVLLARLVIEDKIGSDEGKPFVDPKNIGESKPEEQEKSESEKAPITPVVEQTNAPEPKHAPPEIRLGAQIHRFGVSYDRRRSILQARFRVYNENQPKVSLTGKVIVVFKKAQDPSVKWISVPAAQIINRMPDSTKGKLFKIKNYRTITLNAYGMKPPIIYDTAAVYVFSEEGDLLLNEEHDFKIAEPPPQPSEQPHPALVDEPTTPVKSGPMKVEPAVKNNEQENSNMINTTDNASHIKTAPPPSSQSPETVQNSDSYNNAPQEDTLSGSDTGTGDMSPQQPDTSRTQESTNDLQLQEIPSVE